MSAPNNARIKGGKRGAGGVLAIILASVFAVEGGYVNNPDDPGGATNHGCTEAVVREFGWAGNMRDLPKGVCEQIYIEKYIKNPGYEELALDSLALGHEIVDTGVNAGTSRASRWFQESLNHFNEKGRVYPDLKVDGQLGPKSMAAWRLLKRRRGEALACELIIKAMDAKQAAHYMRLADTSDRFETFMVGWFRTRIWNVPLSECVK